MEKQKEVDHGGGSINIFYFKKIENNNTINASGGFRGGAGCVTVNQINI